MGTVYSNLKTPSPLPLHTHIYIKTLYHVFPVKHIYSLVFLHVYSRACSQILLIYHYEKTHAQLMKIVLSLCMCVTWGREYTVTSPVITGLLWD